MDNPVSDVHYMPVIEYRRCRHAYYDSLSGREKKWHFIHILFAAVEASRYTDNRPDTRLRSLERSGSVVRAR